MTAGARPGLMKLYADFRDLLSFVSLYVREAHPGERYPYHTSDAQKMQHAKDWAEQDKIPWTVAVEGVDGAVHQGYGTLPNSVYLINRSGKVAFRALWAGQEALLRGKIDELVRREASGEESVILGEQENLLIPLIHGAAEFDHPVGRGGKKAKEDFHREMGGMMYGSEILMSKIEPVVNRGNKDIE